MKKGLFLKLSLLLVAACVYRTASPKTTPDGDCPMEPRHVSVKAGFLILRIRRMAPDSR